MNGVICISTCWGGLSVVTTSLSAGPCLLPANFDQSQTGACLPSIPPILLHIPLECTSLQTFGDTRATPLHVQNSFGSFALIAAYRLCWPRGREKYRPDQQLLNFTSIILTASEEEVQLLTVKATASPCDIFGIVSKSHRDGLLQILQSKYDPHSDGG